MKNTLETSGLVPKKGRGVTRGGREKVEGGKKWRGGKSGGGEKVEGAKKWRGRKRGGVYQAY